jgi:hypothetical protein
MSLDVCKCPHGKRLSHIESEMSWSRMVCVCKIDSGGMIWPTRWRECLTVDCVDASMG